MPGSFWSFKSLEKLSQLTCDLSDDDVTVFNSLQGNKKTFSKFSNTNFRSDDEAKMENSGDTGNLMFINKKWDFLVSLPSSFILQTWRRQRWYRKRSSRIWYIWTGLERGKSRRKLLLPYFAWREVYSMIYDDFSYFFVLNFSSFCLRNRKNHFSMFFVVENGGFYIVRLMMIFFSGKILNSIIFSNSMFF